MSKTIAIIGAGEGVGYSLAQRFGREGFQVALLSRNPAKINAIADRLSAKGIPAKAFRADVLDLPSLVSALNDVKDHFGAIDVLEYSPMPEIQFSLPRNLSVEEQEFHLKINVLGPVAAVQTVLPDMTERKSGTILFTGAVSALRPLAITAAYGVAAGAMLNYSRILNKDVSSDGIFVSYIAIAAIVIPTGLTDSPVADCFPPNLPRVKSEDVADLHWKLYLNRDDTETVIGDADCLYATPGIY